MPADLTMHAIDATDAGLINALAGASLPTEDIAEDGRRFFRFESDGAAIGYGGYEAYGQDALIRSIVVLAGHRGKGWGQALTGQLLADLAQQGVAQAFLLTTDARIFFERLGFTSMQRQDAPASILATQQATHICSSAALLCRRLGEE